MARARFLSACSLVLAVLCVLANSAATIGVECVTSHALAASSVLCSWRIATQHVGSLRNDLEVVGVAATFVFTSEVVDYQPIGDWADEY